MERHAPPSTGAIPPRQSDPDMPPLDPSNVHLFSDPRGFLRATVGDQTYLDVTVVRAFPQSVRDEYIGLLSGQEEEIGIIRQPDELDEESRKIVEAELEKRYFLVRIREVLDISEEFGATYWDVETDRGPRSFVAKGLRDNVTFLGNNRILIQDVDGNRYEIEDLYALDAPSRTMVLHVV
jgi:uncharacterized protein DUF1854